MPLEILFTREATASLRRLTLLERMRVLQRLGAIADAPEAAHHDVPSAVGPGGGRRLRIDDWRVVFKVGAARLEVLRIDHRPETKR